MTTRERWLLSGAGACLAMMPLLQGQWLAALFACFGGFLVVGAWAWGASGGPLAITTVGIGLITMLAATFAVSQWPRGNLIIAPWGDWFVWWPLIGAVCVAALFVDWRVHARNGTVPTGMFEGQRVRPLTGIVAASCLVAMVLGCCGMFVLTFGDDARRFEPSASEIGAMPPTLRLVSVSPCGGGGSSGNCGVDFVVVATDGAAGPIILDRLAVHLRGVGWPLEPFVGSHRGYSGCREAGGLLSWTAHCMVVQAGSGSATIRIDNIG